MTTPLVALLMPQALDQARTGRGRELITTLATLKAAYQGEIPRQVASLDQVGWDSTTGWTPCGLLANLVLGTEVSLPEPEALFRVWDFWAKLEDAHPTSAVRRGATASGLTKLAWASLDLEYEWDIDARDAFERMVHSALYDTLAVAQQHATNLEDRDSNLHLLLDPTHPEVFASVRAFASDGERSIWPTPRAHVDHVRRVVRHASRRLAEHALDERAIFSTQAAEHFPDGSHARWLDLVRHKLLTVATARSHPDEQARLIQAWVKWLHDPAVPSELHRATVVRLVAPWSGQDLKGNLRDDAVAAAHWPALLPYIGAVAPEAVAWERHRNLQILPGMPRLTRSRPRA